MREIEIEQLLQWAYRDELPKRGVGDVANQWTPMRKYFELLTIVDDEPGFPVIMGPPHPDALTIERAVQGLRAELQFEWSEYRMLIMADMAALAPTDSPLGRFVFSEIAFVESCARQGARPRWDIGRPRARRVLGRNHRPVLVGESKGDGRYTIGSHCPLEYVDPTIEQLAMRRAEYLVWRGALDRLLGILKAWTLLDWTPTRPVAPAVPWLDPLEAPRPAPIQGVAQAWRTWPEPKGKRSRVATR